MISRDKVPSSVPVPFPFLSLLLFLSLMALAIRGNAQIPGPPFGLGPCPLGGFALARAGFHLSCVGSKLELTPSKFCSTRSGTGRWILPPSTPIRGERKTRTQRTLQHSFASPSKSTHLLSLGPPPPPLRVVLQSSSGLLPLRNRPACSSTRTSARGLRPRSCSPPRGRGSRHVAGSRGTARAREEGEKTPAARNNTAAALPPRRDPRERLEGVAVMARQGRRRHPPRLVVATATVAEAP